MTSTDTPARASIVSGYFNPLHVGHLDMIEDARSRTGFLVVIVNNDAQQLLKKGKIIQGEGDRVRIVRALRSVDDALISVDEGPGIEATLDAVRVAYPDTELLFCNGGDDRNNVGTLPPAEAASAERNRIQLVYGVGGSAKADSSSRINSAIDG